MFNKKSRLMIAELRQSIDALEKLVQTERNNAADRTRTKSDAPLPKPTDRDLMQELRSAIVRRLRGSSDGPFIVSSEDIPALIRAYIDLHAALDKTITSDPHIT